MEPPPWPQGKRKGAAKSQQPATSSKYASDDSPSPFSSVSNSTSTRRPRSNQTVSIGWEEAEVSRGMSRMQIELAECVETQTVTTTTTTKRSYPPLLVRNPQSLESLDLTEYPLAIKPPPAGLTDFSYEIERNVVAHDEEDITSNLSEKPDLAALINDNVQLTGQDGVDGARPKSSRGLRRTAEPELEHIERTNKKRAPLRQKRYLRGVSDVQLSSPISVGSRARRSQVGAGRRAVSDGTGSRTTGRPRRPPMPSYMTNVTPATPDLTIKQEISLSPADPAASSAALFGNTITPQSGFNQNESFDSTASPSFSSAVATPPILESDLESEVTAAFAQALTQRPTLNTVAAQNASLPSPGLSPTFATQDFAEEDVDDGTDTTSLRDFSEDDGTSEIEQPSRTVISRSPHIRKGQPQYSPSVMDAGSMIDTFDAMPTEMKSFMMYQFLRRCSRKTLNVVADVVNPALKCDFLARLPAELSLEVLSFLNFKDLCRASQVSKQWRTVVDTNETCWKELFDRDGYVMPTGELERAITQGWGWQDPLGPNGSEHDLSIGRAPAPPRGLLIGVDATADDGARKVRPTTKRKRVVGSLVSERAKRRSAGHEFLSRTQELPAKHSHAAKFHKSEGPLTAANAAALAIPDPQLGWSSIRNLHLFKSLYRRHHMFRLNWMSGDVEPHHMAFPAHPSHVITCLQFDDDKILTGSDDSHIHVYDTKTGALRQKLQGHEGGVWALQYEGNVLVSGSTDRSVRVWDIEKGLCTQVFHGHTSTVRCLQILMPVETGAFTKTGQPIMVPEKPLIITGSRDSQLRVWKLPEQGSKRYIQTGPPANDADCPYFVRVLTGHTQSVRAIAAHQDTLVSGSYDNTVRVWKISTGETMHKLLGHLMKVYSVVLDHKRNRCISGSMDNSVKIWCLDTGACLYTLEGHSSLVGLLDLRDDRLVSAAADATLRIWDPEKGLCKSTLTAHTGAITCFQHDGQKVISGSDRTLKLWNIKTGECMKDLLTDLSGVWQVKFDERRCVAAVQRDNLTYVEVLDFGASRDGILPTNLGNRILLEARTSEDE